MIAVIGGGASGCMAAIQAARAGAAKVVLYEQNEKLGKKLYITGKGRCNLTNDGTMEEHRKHVFRNSRFLYSSYHFWDKDKTKEFFEELGLPLKTERGQRVFPASDKSSDVIRALQKGLDRCGVEIRLNTRVTEIQREENRWTVCTKTQKENAKAVIIATGGVSVPATGSTGDGHAWAKQLSHRVTPLYPSLTGMDLDESWIPPLAGLTLKNVRLTVRQSKKSKDAFGDLLLTHSGLSGPIVLELSAWLPSPEADFSLDLNLKPALTPEQIDKRLLREFEAAPKRELGTVLRSLLPASLVAPFCADSPVDENRRVCDITAAQRAFLVQRFHNWPLKGKKLQGLTHAIITRGGVDVREVDPSTLMSKRADGLFFCGELLDIDADTGGYNLQIAWSTGAAAGNGAAAYIRKEGNAI